jgi:hypothetical protein
MTSNFVSQNIIFNFLSQVGISAPHARDVVLTRGMDLSKAISYYVATLHNFDHREALNFAISLTPSQINSLIRLGSNGNGKVLDEYYRARLAGLNHNLAISLKPNQVNEIYSLSTPNGKTNKATRNRRVNTYYQARRNKLNHNMAMMSAQINLNRA